MSDYQITDEDIAAAGRYMKAIYPDNPEKAEPAYCLAFLEYIQSRVSANVRSLALTEPDQFEKLADEYEQFEASQKDVS